ncbi:Uncharacterized membrane protein YozB, DUF420 family [Halanaeroarchaeum sp. HSR-CO]|uniref:DUF420 domain-containing protein n=1 Tax=Halanaeroarchaeum sp. HSR-CO TaxID=2866382 RepID=UPI00217F1254|nr:DUF420 domain-containing protein [Halanaeroarchaeum sp. HSR-CO]UWG48240.1 Uncharacterized membrane protein YozB, DUF420 family [Halanaeroarchaeum sp. HSR-CO]
MDASGTDRSWAAAHPRIVTVTVSLVGYAVVIASFTDLVSLPALEPATVNLLSHLIAGINTVALSVLVAGVVFVRRGDVDRHRRSMLIAFGLILLFLVLYVWKQAGGFTKGLVVTEGHLLGGYAGIVSGAYLVMLAIHILLSIVAVPFVVHALVLGLTRPVEELPETAHPTVGRIAVAAWTTSLALGILTYLMLNHIYDWERIRGAALLFVFGSRPATTIVRSWAERIRR